MIVNGTKENSRLVQCVSSSCHGSRKTGGRGSGLLRVLARGSLGSVLHVLWVRQVIVFSPCTKFKSYFVRKVNPTASRVRNACAVDVEEKCLSENEGFDCSLNDKSLACSVSRTVAANYVFYTL